MKPKLHTFKNGIVFKVDHWLNPRPKCYTIFPDGREVHGIAKENDFQTAREHGYGFDIWALNWQHEFIHNWLAEYENKPYSFTLDYVSNGGTEPTKETIEEEIKVLSLQKWLNNIDVQIDIPEVELYSLEADIQHLSPHDFK